MELYLVTGNENKLKEAREILGMDLKNIDLDIDEIQTIQVKELIVDKANKAFAEIKKPVIVEDVGLYIEAWNGFPGALIKWALKTMDVQGIVDSIKNFSNHKAVAEVGICYFDGINHKLFWGRNSGKITSKLKGKNGFGFDPIFEVNRLYKTLAELNPNQKNRISMRGQAYRKLKKFLRR